MCDCDNEFNGFVSVNARKHTIFPTIVVRHIHLYLYI